jgi:hypothetical protein
MLQAKRDVGTYLHSLVLGHVTLCHVTALVQNR